jgi:cell fate regulator YaaT (PSP1 superfamily)
MEELDNYRNIQRGCSGIKITTKDINQEGCASCMKTDSCNKLNVYDWLDEVPPAPSSYTDIVEVRFKNTRKGFYRNVNNLDLQVGDVVAVEASPGHDIGVVSVKGPLVFFQLKKARINLDQEFKKIYRKAKTSDIEKWKQFVAKEDGVMLRSRQIADNLHLNMKIGDVEFQGDGTKAIFYYIADERVDFRELIKIMAEEFKIRIEMKQIGARQEAGRIGGIGPCGRELCCTTWITNFVSVSTNSARQQELSPNPQKLAGQCGKLKCCLNYELDAYIDAQKDFPNVRQPLETMEGTAYHQKTDIFKRVMWYSYDQNSSVNITVVPIDRVKEILDMNKAGKKPDTLLLNDKTQEKDSTPSKVNDDEFTNDIGTDSITRFDNSKRKKRKNKKNKGAANANANQSKQNNQPEVENQQKQNPVKNNPPNPNKNKNRNSNNNPNNGQNANPNQRREKSGKNNNQGRKQNDNQNIQNNQNAQNQKKNPEHSN